MLEGADASGDAHTIVKCQCNLANRSDETVWVRMAVMPGQSGGVTDPAYDRNARDLVGVCPCDASVRPERWFSSTEAEG